MLTSLKPGYYLGIDSGATKTEATITKESGFVVGIGRAGTANLHNVSPEVAFSNIDAAIEAAKTKARDKHPELEIEEFEATCIGLSGLDTPADRKKFLEYFNKLLPDICARHTKKLIVASNGLTGLMSGSEEVEGICLIAATGSNCYGISRVGKETTAGNWGYLLGDQGSAYALGRKILAQVMKEYDGRAPKTKLTPAVLEFLELADPGELVGWTYRQELPVREIASLSQMCDNPNLADVVEIAEMVNSTIEELVLAYKAVIDRLKFRAEDSFPVVLVGGLFRMKGKFSDKVIRSILNLTPKARIVIQNRSVGEGAALIARMHEQIKLFPESLIVTVRPETH